jgi:hypothetical protein
MCEIEVPSEYIGADKNAESLLRSVKMVGQLLSCSEYGEQYILSS